MALRKKGCDKPMNAYGLMNCLNVSVPLYPQSLMLFMFRSYGIWIFLMNESDENFLKKKKKKKHEVKLIYETKLIVLY
jgi:hypothetical protein